MQETGKRFLTAREHLGIAGLQLRICCGLILPLCSGAHQFGVRWNTVRCPAVFATSWIVCMPVAPVPMTATRLPAKRTGSFGQRAVWQDCPWKRLNARDRWHGRRRERADRGDQEARVWRLPSSSVTSQLPRRLLPVAAVTRLRNLISRRRSNLSAT